MGEVPCAYFEQGTCADRLRRFTRPDKLAVIHRVRVNDDDNLGARIFGHKLCHMRGGALGALLDNGCTTCRCTFAIQGDVQP
jgi:hypothetical protein